MSYYNTNLFEYDLFQILMNDLDPDFMSLFSTHAFASSDDLIKGIGLAKVMPAAQIDAKIFDPCGFSLNAIEEVRTVALFYIPTCLVGLVSGCVLLYSCHTSS